MNCVTHSNHPHAVYTIIQLMRAHVTRARACFISWSKRTTLSAKTETRELNPISFENEVKILRQIFDFSTFGGNDIRSRAATLWEIVDRPRNQFKIKLCALVFNSIVFIVFFVRPSVAPISTKETHRQITDNKRHTCTLTPVSNFSIAGIKSSGQI